MGDASDMTDVERFMRSEAGTAHLEEIAGMLERHTITDVTFSNEVHCIATTLHLDDGQAFVIFQPSLEVDALREEFADTIEDEYYKDFPERRPKADG
jgi:hypothetical protein